MQGNIYDIDFAQNAMEYIYFRQHAREHIYISDNMQGNIYDIDFAQHAMEYIYFGQHAREQRPRVSRLSDPTRGGGPSSDSQVKGE